MTDNPAQHDKMRRNIEQCTLRVLMQLFPAAGEATSNAPSSGSPASTVPVQQNSCGIENSSYLANITKVPHKNVADARDQAQAFKVMKEAYMNAGERSYITKRSDLFYRDVELFGRQTQSDRHIMALCNAFGVDRETLGFRATAKGLVSGSFNITLRDSIRDPQDADARANGTIQGTFSTEHLVPFATDIESFDTDAAWVLIVEKDAIFSILRQARFATGAGHGLKPGIIVTGKGYPDQGTQQFLTYLAFHPTTQSAPFFLLTDNDPFGIDILRMYKFGNGTPQNPGAYALPNVTWLGLHHEQHSPSQNLLSERSEDGPVVSGKLPMSIHDRKKATSLLSKDWLPQRWKLELQHMLAQNCKAEIEILLEQSTGDHMRRSEAEPHQCPQSIRNLGGNEPAAQDAERREDIDEPAHAARQAQPLLDFLAAQMKFLRPSVLRQGLPASDQATQDELALSNLTSDYDT